MSYFRQMVCIRCGRPLADGRYYDGCPACRAEGIGANYTAVYDLDGASLPGENGQPGIYRYRQFYPLADDAEPVSIGEGNTPLLPLRRLGQQLGLHRLYAKDETRNPTLSYKDRICSLLVTKARYDRAPAVTIASTGNHGAAAAAYAAAAGLPCIIFTVPQVPETMKTLMQAYGACVVVTPTAEDRWTIMGQCVRALGWFPMSGFRSPAIGSNAYGIDAYKSIMFEIYEQLGRTAPAAVSVPACYADGLYGVYKGALDLQAMGCLETLPRFVGSEVFGSLQKTVESGAEAPVAVPSEWSVSFSIATSRCTWQGLAAIRGSQGYARSSTDRETLEMQQLLARTEGIYAEASSVTSLVALQKLAQEGRLSADDPVVAVLTSTGLKDPGAPRTVRPPVPQSQPALPELRRALRDCYGVEI